ncbi:MAG: serine/threonine protein kinase [Thermoleophilia bacterium]|nr:serine/threonine protein kinase [Thermoleophilia bacterium]
MPNAEGQMIGSTVLQRFEVNDRLGAGGFGTVYRAWDNRLERDVAVKVIETGPESGPRIQREAQAAARLNHPGIVTLFEFAHHEFGREGGRAFLISELVEGETVRELIDGDLLSDREVAEIGADVCEALDHAHSRGVVHRDLKPANLISPYREGGAKLMDFGVARLTDGEDLTNTGDVLGTLSYMAPEQAEGEPVGPPGDVYSLALTLYEAWTGENPRRKPTPGASLRALDQDLPPLGQCRPDLPAPLTDLLDACLDREPEYRPDLETLGLQLEGSLDELDDTVPGESRKRASAFAFADTEFDLPRVAAAAAVGGLVATGMIVTGAGDFGSVSLISLISALLALINTRLGFLVGAAGLAAWLTVIAGMAGAALVVVLIGVLPAIFVRGTGRPLVFGPAGPLLGTLGLAPFMPVLAALADDWRDRAIVALIGVSFTGLAESITGQRLLFGKMPPAADGWQDSAGSAVSGLLVPALSNPTFLVSVAVWVLIAVMLGAIIKRARLRRESRSGGVLTFTPVGSNRVPNAH